MFKKALRGWRYAPIGAGWQLAPSIDVPADFIDYGAVGIAFEFERAL